MVLERVGGNWRVRQRLVSLGIDQPAAGRFWSSYTNSYASIALVGDRQGTTVAALRPNGTLETLSNFCVKDAYGATGYGGCGTGLNSETGYTGASTPNATGGFVYLRNRWYDPQSGRFLTQDPIGLAGGVNLYAYAGGNPVSFSDPWGLSPRPRKWMMKVLEAALELSTILGAGDGPGPSPMDLAPDQTPPGMIGTVEANVDEIKGAVADAGRTRPATRPPVPSNLARGVVTRGAGPAASQIMRGGKWLPIVAVGGPGAVVLSAVLNEALSATPLGDTPGQREVQQSSRAAAAAAAERARTSGPQGTPVQKAQADAVFGNHLFE